MTIPRSSSAAVERAIDTALWIAQREERRLMARIASNGSSSNSRFQALVELAHFSRQVVLRLAGSKADDEPVDRPE